MAGNGRGGRAGLSFVATGRTAQGCDLCGQLRRSRRDRLFWAAVWAAESDLHASKLFLVGPTRIQRRNYDPGGLEQHRGGSIAFCVDRAGSRNLQPLRDALREPADPAGSRVEGKSAATLAAVEELGLKPALQAHHGLRHRVDRRYKVTPVSSTATIQQTSG